MSTNIPEHSVSIVNYYTVYAVQCFCGWVSSAATTRATALEIADRHMAEFNMPLPFKRDDAGELVMPKFATIEEADAWAERMTR